MSNDFIYVVKRSVSYDISGEEYEISYHRSREGAFIKMDEIAPEYGFSKEHLKNYPTLDDYSYSKDSESLYVENIKIED